MLFTSREFFVLYAVTFLLYYLPPLRRIQVGILIVASLSFYAWSDPALLLLLIGSIAINSLASYMVAFNRERRARIAWATAGILLNLGILVLFKYGALVTNLFLQSFGVAATPTEGLAYLLLHMPLPIGISFYTFEGISLVVDTLRQEHDAELGKSRHGWDVDRNFLKHVANTSFFVAFFPHLIAGPVLKAKSFFPQIKPKALGEINWDLTLRSLLIGYFLKVFVADNLQDYTFWLTYPYYQTQGTITNLVLLYGYSIQIFADFAGYSLIAIGLAAGLGYELMQNFNFPYISRSLAEFWRRWHISLSTWLRDYLYIPLGGNRKGEPRTYLNLLIVMTLGGLWHGSTWSYAIWGVFHGLGLGVERFFKLDRVSEGAVAGSWLRRWLVDGLRVVAIFGFVTVGWVFFKLPDFGQALDFFATLPANLTQAPALLRIVPVILYSIPVLLYHLPHYPTILEGGLEPLARHSRVFWRAGQYAVYGLMLTLLALNPGSSEAFIYFQF
ncbi:MAG: MBOAT family protein [Oscillochloris sp.]|nr:MBOAT family protein [Oscillochloris sp.]